MCDVVAHLIEDSRKPLAKIFERIGLCCFAFAVAAELAAYKYGQRNDDLSAGVINSLDAKSKEAFGTATNAHNLAQSASDVANAAKGEAEEAQKKALVADTHAAKANLSALQAEVHANAIGDELKNETDREQAAERQLEGEKVKRLKLAASLSRREVFDQSGIIGRLSTTPPHRVILLYADDREAKQYAEEIAWIFLALKWPYFGRVVDEDRVAPGVSIGCGEYIGKPASPQDWVQPIHELTQGREIASKLRVIFADAHVELSENQHVDTETALEETPSTLLIGVGPKMDTELTEALRELGTPEPTPMPGSLLGIPAGTFRMSRNRVSIPPDPTFKPKSGNP